MGNSKNIQVETSNMLLDWKLIRARATRFASRWLGHGYEKGQTQLFYQDFFEVFDANVRKVADFEKQITKLSGSTGYIDLYWPRVLLVEQKSKGKSLIEAKKQADEYFAGLKQRDVPRYMLLCDFQNFELYDRVEDSVVKFKLSNLPKHVKEFGFLKGVVKRPFKDQDPVNIEASELVGKIHDDLKKSGYKSPNLEKILVRIVFCMFADSTGIFQDRESFLDLLKVQSTEKDHNVGRILAHLFQTLNEPIDHREISLDQDLKDFPYVDGGLFDEQSKIPSFSVEMTKNLIEACSFDWSAISPAIFGSLFQFVMDREERRKQGAHYTTEKNIMKVLEPLFLTGLWEEFERIKGNRGTHRRKRLKEFQVKLSKMTFFDPACGCGNFLVIAYRELRRLEIEVIRELRSDQRVKGQGVLDASELSLINVDQFYGIEINDFAVRIAETAMWMMDHIMNNRLSLEFGQNYARIPINKSPRIVVGDALELDWSTVIAPTECSYIIGNPPFQGAKPQTAEKRAMLRQILAAGKSGGTLDYVAGWFIKAAEYIQNSKTQIGFVATNSITQGEQVAQLWPKLLDEHGLDITFAHQTFAWESEARGKAHVHVVIIGLAKEEDAPKDRTLYTYEDLHADPFQTFHSAISPYLFGLDSLTKQHVVVHETLHSLNGFPPIAMGSQPIDDNNYIFTDDEKRAFLDTEPRAKPYLRPYVGGQEFLQGKKRWILDLNGTNHDVLEKIPAIWQRVEAVRKFRSASNRKSTRDKANKPEEFGGIVIPHQPFLVIPGNSSEKRDYVPIGWLRPPIIPSNAIYLVESTDTVLFGILMSAMHMSWMRLVGGRLTSRYRYSAGLVYNTFPVPQYTESQKTNIAKCGQQILDIRSKYPRVSLSQLYNRTTMPTDLLNAHQALDRVVDKLYRKEKFNTERERCEHLLARYEKMTQQSN